MLIISLITLEGGVGIRWGSNIVLNQFDLSEGPDRLPARLQIKDKMFCSVRYDDFFVTVMVSLKVVFSFSFEFSRNTWCRENTSAAVYLYSL